MLASLTRVLVIGAILVTGMHLAATLVNPVLVAFAISVIASPAVYWLEQRGLRRWIAASAVVGIIAGVSLLLLAVLGVSLLQLDRALPAYQELLKEQLTLLDGTGTDLAAQLPGSSGNASLLPSLETIIAGLAVWLEEGCNEGCKEVLEDVEPEPAEKTALSGCDLRSFATPSGAEGVPGLLSIPGTTAGRVQPLPGVLDRGTFVRVKTEIGRCDICDRGKAVYRSREARTNICEGCYSRLVRERNGREGVR